VKDETWGRGGGVVGDGENGLRGLSRGGFATEDTIVSVRSGGGRKGGRGANSQVVRSTNKGLLQRNGGEEGWEEKRRVDGRARAAGVLLLVVDERERERREKRGNCRNEDRHGEGRRRGDGQYMLSLRVTRNRRT
jgi:hypothetical protein